MAAAIWRVVSVLSLDTFAFRTHVFTGGGGSLSAKCQTRGSFPWPNVWTVFEQGSSSTILKYTRSTPNEVQKNSSTYFRRIVIYCQVLFRTRRRQCRGTRIRSRNQEAVTVAVLGKARRPWPGRFTTETVVNSWRLYSEARETMECLKFDALFFESLWVYKDEND